MAYHLLLYVHVMSSTLLFGTGLGTAFHGWMAQRSRDLSTIAVVGRNVVLADWIFTAPAVVVQPVTGVWLVNLEGIPFRTPWLAAAIVLYVVTGLCWLPVVWLQVRMHALAKETVVSGTSLPDVYFAYARSWFLLGWPAFGCVLAIFYLMLAKPDVPAIF